MGQYKQHCSNVGIAVNVIGVAQLFSSPAEAKIYKGTVTKVSDGDTIRFMPDGAAADEKAWSIRMMTMDTAELHLPAPGGVYSQGYWAEEGKYALQKLISVGDRVEIDHFGMDSYGRVLGKIYKGEMEVNFEMIRSGWAALYVICDEKSCDLDPAYRTACRKAVNSGSGLFNPANPVPELPFLYR